MGPARNVPLMIMDLSFVFFCAAMFSLSLPFRNLLHGRQAALRLCLHGFCIPLGNFPLW